MLSKRKSEKPVPRKTLAKKIPRKDAWIKIHQDGREVLSLDTAKGKQEYIRRSIAVWSKNDERCFYCKRKIDALELVCDHWIPKGMGGATHDDRIENLRPSCYWCNSKKASVRLARPEDLALIP